MSQSAYIVWNSSLSVGVKAMDDQHQIMIEIINHLYNAILSGNSERELRKIIDQMVDYTRFHFSSEETMLNNHKYPEYHKQKLEHSLFNQKVIHFQDQVRKGNIILSTEVLTFLKDWWTGHIRGLDQKYSQFLNSKGET